MPCCSFLDAIKAVDEACDESQRRRVRQETARIVSNTLSFPLAFAADFPRFSYEFLTLPSVKGTISYGSKECMLFFLSGA